VISPAKWSGDRGHPSNRDHQKATLQPAPSAFLVCEPFHGDIRLDGGHWKQAAAKQALPRRDLWLLPLIALLTVLALSAAAEVAARIGWPEQKDNSCKVPDPVLGYRFKPGCVSTMKAAEGPWFTNAYNACGYRSAQPCIPAPAGTHRIVLVGSSMAEGYLVPYQDTIGRRLAQDLTERCSAPVEVQNLGGLGYFAEPRLLARLEEGLKLHADTVLLVVTPFDLETGIMEEDAKPAATQAERPLLSRARLFIALKESRAFVVAQHFRFRDPAVYLPLYLSYGDKADFLRPPFTPAWQERLRRFDSLMTEAIDRTRAAGVPLVVAFVPQEAELLLMAKKSLPSGVDPYALPRALADIATRHNANFIDTSAMLKTLSSPEQLYYQVDGHLSGSGQPSAAAAIASLFQGDTCSPPGSAVRRF